MNKEAPLESQSDPISRFSQQSRERAARYAEDLEMKSTSADFMQKLIDRQYAYNFFWCGVPVIQIPQELQAMQEIIWQVKPECIVETGIAWGGSLIFSASMLAILEACGSIKKGTVVGVDIEIRPHNKANISSHPLASKISLIEGSSIDEKVIAQVSSLVKGKRALVILDSNHTHAHVLEELRLYSHFVDLDSYFIVGDTGIELFANAPQTSRPWGKGDSPKTAVDQFMTENEDFVIDRYFENKLILTGSSGGYLKRVRDSRRPN